MIGAAVLVYIYDDIIKITGLEDESIFDAGFSARADRLTAATSGIDIANYNIAEKMFAFWFRPLFFDAPGMLGVIVSFENLFYLFVFASLFHPKAIAFLLKADPVTKTCFITFIGVSIALAQISGNLGLAMRQKSQVMILMMFVILKFMDEQKIVNLQRIAFRKRDRAASCHVKRKARIGKMNGIFTISLDFELHWGGFEKWPIEEYRQYFLNTRKVIPEMLKLFGQYEYM